MLGLVVVPVAGVAQSNWEEGERLIDAFSNSVEARTGPIDTGEPMQLFPGLSVMAGSFAEEEVKSFNLPVAGGQEVIVAGGADEETDEVVVRILNADGQIMNEAADLGRRAQTRFTAPVDGVYTLQVKLVGTTDGRGYGALTLFVPSETSFNDEPLVEAFATLYNNCSAVMRSGAESDFELAAQENRWALFGGTLTPFDSWSVNGITLGDGVDAIVGTASDNLVDIDMGVEAGGEDVASDDADDPYPLCLDAFAARDDYEVTMYNATDQPGFSLFAILHGKAPSP